MGRQRAEVVQNIYWSREILQKIIDGGKNRAGKGEVPAWVVSDCKTVLRSLNEIRMAVLPPGSLPEPGLDFDDEQPRAPA